MTPNAQQALVVEHFDGPCLVLAVPGSGKTASVTERTKRLISRGIDPRSILCVTFTNKAAHEMKHRVGLAVGPDKASLMTISTFHSLCSRIIRWNAAPLGLTEKFSIYKEDAQERLLKRCIQVAEGEDSNFKPDKEYIRSLLAFIEGKRNACLDDQAAALTYNIDGNQPKAARLYFEELRSLNALDYTGLLSEANRLFAENPAVRDRYRARFKFISVDEVQDTNIVQYELIKHLGLGHKNVLIVGDLDQSIYKFRNACPENILKFEQEFTGCKVLKLEKNYRSTPSILKHAQKLIENNVLRKGTQLTTDNSDLLPPRIRCAHTDSDMADMIAYAVKHQISTGVKPKEIVVLYRTNYASRVLELAFRKQEIKYRIIGGTSFWDRKEIKTSLHALQLLCNWNDQMAFEHVAEECCKGAGHKTFGVVSNIAKSRRCSIVEAARQFVDAGSAAGRSLSPLLGAFYSAAKTTPGQGLLNIAQMTAWWKRLQDDSTTVNDRCANVEEMARDVDEYVASGKNNTLAGYLQNISLLTDADEEKDDDGMIKMMTLHGCKGLEFDTVFISHCNEGMLPHARVITESGDDEALLASAIEEERRLLYVGMTRARKSLTLCYMLGKLDARCSAPKPMEPSRFLLETGIPMPKVEFEY